MALTRETFERPEDLRDRSDPAVLYALSYLLTRGVIGVIGLLLPLALIVGEAILDGGVQVRGSLSAYYHTPMRDLFVAALCVSGVFLATYLAGRTDTRDFWLSLVAGVAVIGVVFFPTSRPNLAADAPLCGVTPMPDGCSPVQQQLGETLVAGVHFGCAAVFILSLAWICFEFAYREQEHKHAPRMATILRICGWVILGAVAWVAVGGFLGATIWGLTPLYVGEVVSVGAFGLAWLLKARDLRHALVPPAPERERSEAGG